MKFKWIAFFLCALLVKGEVQGTEPEFQVVLVTGASRGLGFETCRAFAEKGYKVYGTLRKNSPTYSISSLQVKYPGRIETVFLDVTDQDSIKQAVDEIFVKEGKIDILINNAGAGLFGAIESCELEKIQSLFDVNFFGTIRVLQEVLPHMREAKKGRIINVGSRCGFRPAPSLSPYAASKFALEAITETLSFNLEPWNIKVSIIEPGPLATTFDLNMEFGTRFVDDPYVPHLKKYGLTLENGISTSQSPEEVAAQILEIAENPVPNLRYQTTARVKAQAAMIWTDPTGNRNLQSLKEGLSGN